MREIIHTTCGKIAFYTKDSVKMDDIICASDVTKLNGTTPNIRDAIICGNCHQPCRLGDLSFGEIVNDEDIIFTKCPTCMNNLKIITNRRMDEQIELIPICEKCEKAIRDPKYGWKIIKD